MTPSPIMPASVAIVRLMVAFAVATALAAAPDALWASAPPHGTWVDGQGGSCELACRNAGQEAFRSGFYNKTQTPFTICRAPVDARHDLASRPGFQHQSGSPNLCKIQSFEPQRRYDCLCAPPIAKEKLHGTWVDNDRSSCDLACGARKLDAFRSGHYSTTQTHYPICRGQLHWAPHVAGRPGFQHQAGSPNLCKIQGFARDEVSDRHDCLCASR